MTADSKNTRHVFALACVALAISVVPSVVLLMPNVAARIGLTDWTFYNSWGWVPALCLSVYTFYRKRKWRPASKALSLVTTLILWIALLLALLWMALIVFGYVVLGGIH